MRRITVLAIANRLGANQAPGDMVERVARVEGKVDGSSGIVQYTTAISSVRHPYAGPAAHQTTRLAGY
jgi:hypothetical protein